MPKEQADQQPDVRQRQQEAVDHIWRQGRNRLELKRHCGARGKQYGQDCPSV
jgi:hypothetical protein